MKNVIRAGMIFLFFFFTFTSKLAFAQNGTYSGNQPPIPERVQEFIRVSWERAETMKQIFIEFQERAHQAMLNFREMLDQNLKKLREYREIAQRQSEQTREEKLRQQEKLENMSDHLKVQQEENQYWQQRNKELIESQKYKLEQFRAQNLK